MSTLRMTTALAMAAGLVLFGTATPALADCVDCTGDLDGDGDVDLADLAALLANYGTTCVPEGMVSVPFGWFEMGDSFNEGDSDESPVHSVWISTFYIDEYEVTNAQYALFLNAGGNDDHWCADQKILRQGANPPYVYIPAAGYENHPVVYVSYNDATAFCTWRTIAEGMCPGFYRLPNEAEWEKAAGWDPPLQRHYRYGYHQDSIDCTWCNYNSCIGQTTEVGRYNGTGGTHDAQSYYGVYDMSGNVSEWCHDWYGADYYESSPDDNPMGPASGTLRVIRGGNWLGAAYNCRSASRNRNMPSYRNSSIGFRCVSGTP